MNITIKDKEHELKFSYKAFRLLAEKWQLDGVQAVFEKLQTGIADRALDTFVELIQVGSGNVITQDEAGEWVFENMNKLPEITTALMAVFPKNTDEPGKPEAAITLQKTNS